MHDTVRKEWRQLSANRTRIVPGLRKRRKSIALVCAAFWIRLRFSINYRPLPTCLDREPRRHRVLPGDLRKEERVVGSPVQH